MSKEVPTWREIWTLFSELVLLAGSFGFYLAFLWKHDLYFGVNAIFLYLTSNRRLWEKSNG